MDEDVSRSVTTYISTSTTAVPAELLELIENNSLSLLGLVKALGEYLTSTEDHIRTRAVGLLSSVLGTIASAKVNRQSTRVLTGFYCDKLDDVYTLAPTLQGLCVLCALPTFGTGETVQVAQAIFDNIKMRAMVQSLRFLVFKVVDILMAKHRDGLKKMGDSFIGSYCRLADGEKDPRNLLIAFSIARVILVEFEVENRIEDLFDVTFCYFPITYKPPPKDPYGISTEDLRISLRSCLAGTALFSKLAMQLLLDKLAASGGEMKKDTLRTIAACLPVYGEGNAVQHANEIWEAIKVEIIFTSDPEIETEALLALQSFLQTLYPSRPETKPTGIIINIVQQCLEILKEPEKSKAKPATKIVAACFQSSPIIGPYAYSQSLPQLFTQYQKAEDLSHRGPLLEAISQLVQSARELYSSPHNVATSTQSERRTLEADGVLGQHKDELLGCFTSGIKTSSFKRPALEGYMQLVQLEGFLEEEEVGFVVQTLNELILAEDASELRTPALAGLSIISQSSPKPLLEITLPLLFSKLPSTAPPLDAESARDAYRRILSSLSSLCIQPILFEILVLQTTSKLDTLCSPSTPSPRSEEERECQAVYAYALLSCLLAVLRKKVDAGHADVARYIDELVPRLFSIFVVAALSPSGQNEVACDPRLLAISSKIVETVVQTLSVERQTHFARELLDGFRSGKIDQLMHEPNRLPSSPAFAPLEPDVTLQQKNLISLFSAGIIALRPSVDLLEVDLSAFLLSALKWALNSASTPNQFKSMLHIFGSIVNKRCDHILPFLTNTAPEFWSTEVVNRDAPVDRRFKAIRSWVWFCRSLLVRNHDLGFEYLHQLLQLLDEEGEESLALEAARALAIIAEGDGDGVLSKKNHAIIRLLHKQRFFNFVLPRIVSGYTQTQGSPRQTVYLVALASIIKIIPRAICVAELDTLLPLLLRCLDLPDPELKANAMDILLVVAEAEDPKAQEVVESQARTMVEALVRGLDASNKSNERSRSAALRTLSVFPDVVRYDVLHPIKPFVLRELGKALDDKKRAVRKEAVDCRSKWYLYHG